MPSQLSSLLVRDGLSTPRKIERALMHQVVHGGSLDTILLELGDVPEDRLTQYLSLATGLPPAAKSDTEIFDAEAIKCCSREVAETYRVVPLSLSGSVLKVLVYEPVDQTALQRLADEIGLSLAPVITPEYRFHVVFARIYGTDPSERHALLADRQRGVTFGVIGDTDAVIVETHSEDKVVIDTPIPSRAPQPDVAATKKTQPVDADALRRELAAAGVEGYVQGADRTVAEARPALVAKGPEPLEVSEAREALGTATERDEIFELLLRGMRSVTTYAALLTVQGSSAIGRLSIHDGGFPNDDIDSVLVPLDTASAFKNTVASGSPFIGPVASSDDTIDSMTRRLGGVLPGSAMLLPVSLRGRVIAVAVGHCGERSNWIGRASQTFVLASDTAAAIERLLLKKAKAREPAAPTAADDSSEKTTKVESTRRPRGKRKRGRKTSAEDAAR